MIYQKMKTIILIMIISFSLISLFNNSSAALSYIYYTPSGIKVSVDLSPPAELKFSNLIPREKDKSCGAAALATVLTYYYNDPTSENEIISRKNKMSNLTINGYSLLDIKQLAEAEGYKTYALKASLEGLSNINLPSILLLNHSNYPHFVVVREVSKSGVKIADPEFGNLEMPQEQFQNLWNGIVVAIEGNDQPADFTDKEWYRASEAPPTDLVKIMTKQIPSIVSLISIDF